MSSKRQLPCMTATGRLSGARSSRATIRARLVGAHPAHVHARDGHARGDQVVARAVVRHGGDRAAPAGPTTSTTTKMNDLCLIATRAASMPPLEKSTAAGSGRIRPCSGACAPSSRAPERASTESIAASTPAAARVLALVVAQDRESSRLERAEQRDHLLGRQVVVVLHRRRAARAAARPAAAAPARACGARRSVERERSSASTARSARAARSTASLASRRAASAPPPRARPAAGRSSAELGPRRAPAPARRARCGRAGSSAGTPPPRARSGRARARRAPPG